VRKRRAIIFDDDPYVLNLLEVFLKSFDYEVFSFSNPVICPVFGNTAHSCHNDKPCADVMITDFEMPGMNGVDLLRLQKERGCNLDIRNKAVISGFDGDLRSRTHELGCSFFKKPFHLGEIRDWLALCEERVPISVAVGVPRREKRENVSKNITYSLPSRSDRLRGLVTNVSDSGFCLKTDHYLSEQDLVFVDGDLPVSCVKASVRWTRKLEDTSYMAGLSCC